MIPDKEMTEFVSGNEAAAWGCLLARPKVIPAYPITPQTTVIEKISQFCTEGLLDAKFIKMESEHSMVAAALAALAGGVRVFTASSSQGLVYAMEKLYWAGGGRFPFVMVNVNRALCAPWALGPSLDDTLAAQGAGCVLIFCEDAQEILDSILACYRLSEKMSIPSIVSYPGFVVSNAHEPIVIPSQSDVDRFLPPFDPKFKLDPQAPYSIGNPMNSADYTRIRFMLQKDMVKVPDVAKDISVEFEEVFGRKYNMTIEFQNIDTCKILIITMETITSAVREVVDDNPDVGFIKIKMFTPFPKKELKQVFHRIQARISRPLSRVVVIDRNLCPGEGGFTWLKIRSLLHNTFWYYPRGLFKPYILNYITGLNGEYVTPQVIRDIIADAGRRNKDDEAILWGDE